jgi:hypothetical protein
MIGASHAPMKDTHSRRPNCPTCGTALSILHIGTDGHYLEFFRCPWHGGFWMDASGALRLERRAAIRTKSVSGRQVSTSTHPPA